MIRINLPNFVNHTVLALTMKCWFLLLQVAVVVAVPREECSIYLAPSSLQGHTGFGMYTTRDIDPEESFLAAPDLPSIPVHDTQFYGPPKQHNDKWEERQRRRIQLEEVFDNYWWGRGVPDHIRYESDKVFDFQLTFGSLPNHHCILNSIDYRFPSIPYDDSMANSFDSPGAGAFSYHGGRDFFTNKPLKAGHELFLNYGHCNKGDVDQDWAEDIPMPVDYEQAADILLDHLLSLNQTERQGGWVLSGKERKLLVKEDIDPMVANLLPKTDRQWKNIVTGTLLARSDVDNTEQIEDLDHLRVYLVRQLARFVGSTPRSVDWIREHGRCLEHLVPGKSRISHAGFGAFAQHSISAGDVVVPLPLLQIVEKDALAMYDDKGDVWGQQLLLNYCFGHSESSLLLCPTTNAGLINHCSSRTKDCGEFGPNAQVRWAFDFDKDTKEWLNMTVAEMADTTGRGLSLEVVALRDLHPGEEVFIDYQVEFENAWLDHIQQWKPKSTASDLSRESWISAKTANELEDLPETLLSDNWRNDTVGGEHPYLFTGCQYKITVEDRMPEYIINNAAGNEESAQDDHRHQWRMWSDEDILNTFATSGRRRVFGTEYADHGDNSYWPCSILWKEETNDDAQNGASYAVRIHDDPGTGGLPWLTNGFPRILRHYRRSSIHIFVRSYESDHLKLLIDATAPQEVFRHSIGLPIGMWPDQWKNRRNAPTTTQDILLPVSVLDECRMMQEPLPEECKTLQDDSY